MGIGALILTRKIGLAIFGFAIGSLIDQYQQASKNGQGGQAQGTAQDPFEFYRRQSSMYDLPTMLMALSAAVMKADGKVLRIELAQDGAHGLAHLSYESNFFECCLIVNEYEQHQTSLPFSLEGGALVFDLELPIKWNFNN